jgi:hypothetical protein
MIHLYLYLESFENLRSMCEIDMSKLSAGQLADECDNIFQHHKGGKIFFGYLDPGWMLDAHHEARIRNVIRKFDVYLVTFHIESIPFSWKNEIDTLYIQSPKHGISQIIDDGRVV